MREFPNIFDPDNNWPEKCYLVTNKSCTGPMTYQKKTKDEAKNDDELDDSDGMHEVFTNLKKATGLDHLTFLLKFCFAHVCEPSLNAVHYVDICFV